LYITVPQAISANRVFGDAWPPLPNVDCDYRQWPPSRVLRHENAWAVQFDRPGRIKRCGMPTYEIAASAGCRSSVPCKETNPRSCCTPMFGSERRSRRAALGANSGKAIVGGSAFCHACRQCVFAHYRTMPISSKSIYPVVRKKRNGHSTLTRHVATHAARPRPGQAGMKREAEIAGGVARLPWHKTLEVQAFRHKGIGMSDTFHGPHDGACVQRSAYLPREDTSSGSAEETLGSSQS
jgi:hypothetical protein